MREMGFSYDPSTAGSSVRFDPPNKADKVSASYASWTLVALTYPSICLFCTIT